MKTMIEYRKAYCPVDRYNCLMPIEYECMNDDDKPGLKDYRKVGCVCHNVKAGKCSEGKSSCKHFAEADEIIRR